MSVFKDMVEADNKSIFLNVDEFAETHTVEYNGVTYPDIPVLLTKTKETKRPVLVIGNDEDHLAGLHLVTAVAHIALSDMNGVIPEQKQLIAINDGEACGKPFMVRYTIKTSDCEMGMLHLELEAYDE
ncbi:MAG: hypothetical protein ILA17_06225 [Ruminococcus sp.]|nr:hypothetical protein [Ruminiclostridium sp.]MBP1537446.1 hypothetical protein [Ruminococcus sp.]